jgi:hypothetical protein
MRENKLFNEKPAILSNFTRNHQPLRFSNTQGMPETKFLKPFTDDFLVIPSKPDLTPYLPFVTGLSNPADGDISFITRLQN